MTPMVSETVQAQGARIQRNFLIGTGAVLILFLLLGRISSGGFFDPAPTSDLTVGAVGIFRFLFMQLDRWVLAAFVVLALWLLTRPPAISVGLARVLGWIATHTARASLLLFAGLSVAAKLVYDAHPLSMDEYSAVLQSHIFASGEVVGNFPVEELRMLLHAGFWNVFIVVGQSTGEAASIYWPGHALLLTPFTWHGLPWLLSPAVSGGSAWLMFKLTTQLTGSREAGAWAFLMAAASAAFTVTGISYYSMAAHGFFNLLFVVVLLRLQWWSFAVAGLLGGFALVLHNPVPHALFACPWVLWVVWKYRGGRETWLLLGGYALVALSFSVVWRGVIQSVSQATTLYGAAPPGASFLDRLAVFGIQLPSILTVEARLLGFAKVWLWAMPGLIPLAWVGMKLAWGDVRTRLMGVSLVLTLGFYFFVRFDQGHGWGYRYFQPAWVLLPVLAGVAMHRLAGTGEGGLSGPAQAFGHQVWTLVLAGLLVMTPIHWWNVHAFMSWHLSHRIDAQGQTPHVVFVNTQGYLYGVDLIQNYPDDLGRATLASGGHAFDANWMAERRPGWVCVERNERGSLWLPVAAAGLARCSSW